MTHSPNGLGPGRLLKTKKMEGDGVGKETGAGKETGDRELVTEDWFIQNLCSR